MLAYADIDPEKKAFVFEFDNVLYPEKDYLLQVYYLFASFLEFKELLDARTLVKLMTDTYGQDGPAEVFDKVKKCFLIKEEYRSNFNLLHQTARLPLKLLLYEDSLTLLQDIVMDRKQIFILTNGDPQMQLNKIKQTEWHGLENYLVCYFANEIKAKPRPDAIQNLLKQHNLEPNEIVMIGNSKNDRLCAGAAGVDMIEWKP